MTTTTTTTTTSGEHDQSIGIMYPVNWPTDDPEAHCTLFYLGEMPDISFTQHDLIDALEEANLEAPGEVPTAGLELFGPEKDIPVVRLDSLLLRTQKAALGYILRGYGVKDASSFPDYQPHVTLVNPQKEIPTTINLAAPQIWWGNERLEQIGV